ncbi:DUF3662 domain-containing protein [Streptomyces sp. MS2.AVA.5]|uniref:DUF3662 domain-containing protein n=1 Tax=Streptomyces achmelvichensis TaxID=3134111 RepID=A0ACC6PMR1_9ACTN
MDGIDTRKGEPAGWGGGHVRVMGFFGTTERALERWATNVWRLPFPAKRQQLEVVAILHRQCDDNALILGRQRVLAPNAYIVELLPEIHRQLAASASPLELHLVNQVRRHAAEQGYTFAGPVAVGLRPAAGATPRFRIHSRIAPAEPQTPRLATWT